MATKQFSKITVDSANRKKSPFDLSGKLSTSFQFGEVLPVHCRKMVANSSHTVESRSLVRLDPMVAPTSQGRMTVKFWHSFIGMSDIYRHYAAFQTGKSIGGSNGLINFSKLPRMAHADLSLFCLVGAKVTPYILDTTNGETFDSPTKKWIRFKDADSANSYYHILTSKYPNLVASSAVAGSDFESRFPNYSSQGVNYRYDPRIFGVMPYGGYDELYLPLGNQMAGNGHRTLFLGENVNIAKCDFVFYNAVPDPNTPTTTHYFAFAVNMSNYGSRIFDILTVLGIGVDFASNKPVDLSRLFAYYIAYYGSFGLSKYTNYESSNCNRILKAYENGGNNFDLFTWAAEVYNPNFGDAGYLNTLFCHFMTDLAMGYVTEAVDYIASHRRSDVICNDELGWIDQIVVAPGNSANPHGAFDQQNANYPVEPKGTTNAIFINSINHTQVDADLLKMQWKNVNRQTVAGQELEKLLRAGGFGEYVDQQQSHFIGYTDFDIDVTDINATSDSVNTVTGKNSTLGQYVGKGIGANREGKSFSYSTDELGYWITLAAIVPESSYCQGNDLTVYDVERTDQYQLEMDSMGYELHPRSVVKSGADVYKQIIGSSSDEPFGYEPRMMRYKVGHDILAGNFRRRSTRDQYLPFVLSRWLDVDDIFESAAPVETDTQEVITTRDCQQLIDTPIAGDAWRYINLYPWLSNFERIFAFDEKVVGAWATDTLFNRYIYCGERYDYFMLFLSTSHKCMAEMLPVADSWSTTDDNDGNGKTMIQS